MLEGTSLRSKKKSVHVRRSVETEAKNDEMFSNVANGRKRKPVASPPPASYSGGNVGYHNKRPRHETRPRPYHTLFLRRKSSKGVKDRLGSSGSDSVVCK